MTTLRQIATLSFVFATAGIGAAQAQGVTAGDYKLTVGHHAPCALTLTADGSAKPAADCTSVNSVTQWKPTPSGLKLQDNGGNVYGVLSAKGDGYEGMTTEDNHQLVLTH